jgi:hypothetical protein
MICVGLNILEEAWHTCFGCYTMVKLRGSYYKQIQGLWLNSINDFWREKICAIQNWNNYTWE